MDLRAILSSRLSVFDYVLSGMTMSVMQAPFMCCYYTYNNVYILHCNAGALMVPEIKVVQFTAETEVSTRISNKLHSALETFKDVVWEMLRYCHEHNKQLDTYEAHRYRRMLKGRVSKNHDTFLATARQRTIKMLEHELHDECVEKLNGWYVKKGGWKFVEKEGRLYVKLSLPRGHLVMPYDIPWKLVECAKINPVSPASVYLNLSNCDRPRVEVLYKTEEDLEWATTNYAVYNTREQEMMHA